VRARFLCARAGRVAKPLRAALFAQLSALRYNGGVDRIVLPVPESSRADSPADLASELAALLRAGYAVTLIPRFTPYGVVYADVRIVRLANPHTLSASPALSSQGALATFPLRTKIHLVYEMNSLAVWLRQARLLLLHV